MWNKDWRSDFAAVHHWDFSEAGVSGLTIPDLGDASLGLPLHDWKVNKIVRSESGSLVLGQSATQSAGNMLSTGQNFGTDWVVEAVCMPYGDKVNSASYLVPVVDFGSVIGIGSGVACGCVLTYNTKRGVQFGNNAKTKGNANNSLSLSSPIGNVSHLYSFHFYASGGESYCELLVDDQVAATAGPCKQGLIDWGGEDGWDSIIFGLGVARSSSATSGQCAADYLKIYKRMRGSGSLAK